MAGRHRRERPNARVVLSDIDHDSLGPNYEPALISREELMMTIGCSSRSTTFTRVRPFARSHTRARSRAPSRGARVPLGRRARLPASSR